MKHAVVYTARASGHLAAIYDYVSGKAGAVIARSYTRRIEAACQRLEYFPMRGSMRDDIRPGLRIIGFRRRVTIAFTLELDTVVIHGVFYGGQDFAHALIDDARAAEETTGEL